MVRVNVARAALVAVFVGALALGSAAVLLQFQEPEECANDVEPASDAAYVPDTAPEFQYDELSSEGQRAFDRARAASSSVVVTGSACPPEFEYGADRNRYVVVENDTRYVLTTFQNDLLPEVPVAAGVLAYLGLALVVLGALARGDPDARFPALAGVVAATAVVAVSAAVVLDQSLWLAVGWTGVVTGGTLLGAGATLPPRTAGVLGGTVTVLPLLVVLPLTGASVLFLAPAAVPLVLVGVGVAARALGSTVRD